MHVPDQTLDRSPGERIACAALCVDARRQSFDRRRASSRRGPERRGAFQIIEKIVRKGDDDLARAPYAELLSVHHAVGTDKGASTCLDDGPSADRFLVATAKDNRQTGPAMAVRRDAAAAGIHSIDKTGCEREV